MARASQLMRLARTLGCAAAPGSMASVGNLGEAFQNSFGAAMHYSNGPGQQGPGETIDFGFSEVPKHQKASLVAQVFSNVASSYDIMNDLMSGGLHRTWKDQLVDTLGPFPGMQHLDVAGGTGDVAFRVLRAIRAAEALEKKTAAGTRPAQQPSHMQAGSNSQTASQTQGFTSQTQGPHQAGAQPSTSSAEGVRGRVVLCDINAEMLEEGKRKAAAAPDLASDPDGLVFELGNAEDLHQFADNSFDSYTIAFGIRNVTDRPAALREAYRVLKPGGRFLCLEFSQVSQPLLRQAYDAYSFNVIPRIGGLVANDAASYQYLVESIRQFPHQDTWADMITEAGFQAVGYENILGGVVALHSGFKLPANQKYGRN